MLVFRATTQNLSPGIIETDTAIRVSRLRQGGKSVPE
jgi:hypothetical protein